MKAVAMRVRVSGCAAAPAADLVAPLNRLLAARRPAAFHDPVVHGLVDADYARSRVSDLQPKVVADCDGDSSGQDAGVAAGIRAFTGRRKMLRQPVKQFLFRHASFLMDPRFGVASSVCVQLRLPVSSCRHIRFASSYVIGFWQWVQMAIFVMSSRSPFA